MGTRVNCSNSEDKRSVKWAAIAAGFLILMLAVPSWAVDPQEKSVTAAFMMCWRSIAAQDP